MIYRRKFLWKSTASMACTVSAFRISGLSFAALLAGRETAAAKGGNGGGNGGGGNGGGNGGGGNSGGNGGGNGNDGGNGAGGNGNGSGNSGRGRGNGKDDGSRGGKGSPGTGAAPDTGSKNQLNARTGDTISVSGSNVEVTHRNGIREILNNGRYIMRDNRGRSIVDRTATAADRSRIQSLLD